jgi:hypothetical protein
MYLQYGVYDSPAPSTFVRSGPTGQAPILPSWEIVRNYKLEECMTIVLKSEIGHGATGEVLRGTLEVEASACVQLDVAVKLAFATEQRGAIRNEYKMYHLLRERGVTTGITTPLGLFDDVEGEACALVMPYAGIPLSEMPEFVLPFSFRCSAILYISLSTFSEMFGQGSHPCKFEGNTSSQHTSWRSSFGQHTCGGFGADNHRLCSISSVL